MKASKSILLILVLVLLLLLLPFVLFIVPRCLFVVGVSGEDDGSGVRGSGVEQEMGKRSCRYWRESWVNRATFEVGGKETGYYLGILHS
nr:hypothetical protein [Tanacetum cinerariifolium]GFB10175.1 hypothetical protein [Tanacetum cinerariifolium]